jgi:hypothetical protein
VARDLSGGWFDPWAVPGGFDPSGYVKGWAAQNALAAFRSNGICGVLVNAAGDIASSGDLGSGTRDDERCRPDPGAQLTAEQNRISAFRKALDDTGQPRAGRRAGRADLRLLGRPRGAESGAAKDIRSALDRYAEGLNLLCSYVREQGYPIRFAIEPKPNEVERGLWLGVF